MLNSIGMGTGQVLKKRQFLAQKPLLAPQQSSVSFGHQMETIESYYEPNIPYHLERLFELVPKTENHLHLSGSVSLEAIRGFMKENGLSPDVIEEKIKMVKPVYDDLDDFLATYYQVPDQVRTLQQFKASANDVVLNSARENVRVIEIRSSVIKGDYDPRDVVRAIEEGMREGMRAAREELGFDVKTSLTILAQRYKSPKEALEHAKIAVEMGDRTKRPESLVRGFDLGGSEAQHSPEKFKEAFDYINTYGKPLGIGLTIHAGETPASENLTGLQSITAALDMGAQRIGHGIEAAKSEPLMQRIKRDNIYLELCPWSNVQFNYVRPYKNHPFKVFLEHQVPFSLNTDNKMVSAITQTRQLKQLWKNGLIRDWQTLKNIVNNGVEMAFLSDEDKAAVRADIQKEFDTLERRFSNTISRYLSGSHSPKFSCNRLRIVA